MFSGVERMRFKAKEIKDKSLTEKILEQSKEVLKDCELQHKQLTKALEAIEVNKITAQAIIDGLK